VTTIYVLDDDRLFRDLLKTVFELEGYNMVPVTDTATLVPKAMETPPDLILMDVHLAQGDTFGAMRELRKVEGLASVPVIMTSGMDHRSECLQAGADVFLAKPFRPPELLGLIERLVKGRDQKE
jgi:two-component system KDP operon response regulator KdpE